MLRALLLLFFLGINAPILAMQGPGGYNYTLSQKIEDNESGGANRVSGCVCFGGILLGLSGFFGFLGGWGEGCPSNRTAGLSTCRPFYVNGSEAPCVPADRQWQAVTTELSHLNQRTNNSCVPVCHWPRHGQSPYMPTGHDQSDAFGQEAFVYFAENNVDKYDYVLCNNGSYLTRMKDFLSQYKIPFWAAQTEEEDLVGMILPYGKGKELVDEQAYDETITDYRTWRALLKVLDKGIQKCKGRRFK